MGTAGATIATKGGTKAHAKAVRRLRANQTRHTTSTSVRYDVP